MEIVNVGYLDINPRIAQNTKHKVLDSKKDQISTAHQPILTN